MAWDLDRIDTPALIVDMDVAESNLRAMQAKADARGVGLWPHTKTHKVPYWAQRQMALGAEGVTVAKIGEAQVLREAGLPRILIAYPLLGALKIRRLAALIEMGAEVRVALDGREAADAAGEAARLGGGEVGILIEVDTGFHRVGLAAGEEVVRLARYVTSRPGLRYLGIASFAGHVSHARDEAERLHILRSEANTLALTRDMLRQEGLEPKVISVGGSHHTARLDEVTVATELRPGTYIYFDRATLAAGSCTEAEVAAYVLTTVVSRQTAWAVLDAGSKTFGSDPHRDGGFGIVRDHPDWLLDRFSEEHGILTWPEGTEGPKVGDRLCVMPNHICTTVNLHDQAFGLRRGAVERVLQISGRGKVR